MSLNSNGEAVPTTRTWSWSRFLNGLKQGRVPLSVVLMMFIVPLSVGVAAVTWALTYSAALVAASTLANSLQSQILTGIASEFTSRIQALEQAVDEHTRNWAAGRFSAATDVDKFNVVKTLLGTVVPHVYTYTALHFVLLPEGAMWGADSWIEDNTTYLALMFTQGGMFNYWDSNEDGSVLTEDQIYPKTFENAPWVVDLDLTNSTSAAWTQPYLFTDYGFATHSRTIFQNGTFIGVQGGDFGLEFVGDTLRELSATIPYHSYIYAFALDKAGDILIGSSISWEIGDLYRRDNDSQALGLLTLPELAANQTFWEPVRVLHSHLLRTTANGTLFDYLSQPRPTTLELTLSDGVYIVQMKEISSLNLRWGIVHFVLRDDILDALTRSNKKTIGTVAGVVSGGIVITIVFSFFLATALHRITRDLVLLSDFKFKDVLQKDLNKSSGVSRPSFSRIAELWQIQRAFHKMVVTFAGAVSQRRFLERGTGASTTMAPASRAPTSVVHAESV
ncbi:hypothetical protein HK104_002968 [Borealophlyctis nickersoniae]|nr:hypothetical protein HK104_002968 [Borealophlyctis nickersoniae]